MQKNMLFFFIESKPFKSTLNEFDAAIVLFLLCTPCNRTRLKRDPVFILGTSDKFIQLTAYVDTASIPFYCIVWDNDIQRF